MSRSPKQETEQSQAEILAAIDIGSNMIRMAIGQYLPDGQIEVLERLQRGVHMGQDTFRTGRIGRKSMNAAIAILRDYRQILNHYDVKHIHAVATSSVREAVNAETFLDRVLMATGLEVHVINTSEESRLTVSAVRTSLGPKSPPFRRTSLVAEVGGGSTVLTLVKGGEIAASQSLGLGSVRLSEVLATGSETLDRATKLIRNEISTVINTISGVLPLKKVSTFLAIGADARFAADQVGQAGTLDGVRVIEKGQFDRLVSQCQNLNAEQISTHFDLPYADAETLNPALLVYQALVAATNVDQILVSKVTMRDGLLQDLARRISGKEDESLGRAILQSAQAMAERYGVDPEHAHKVDEICRWLFGELKKEHGLSYRHRLLLRTAAWLYKSGAFIATRAYHKHTYYVISNSEIFGLSQSEVNLVAHIARYHRHSRPKPSHTEYMALPRERRIIVNKLAAILRMADALEMGHQYNLDRFRTEIVDDEFVISIPAVSDIDLIRRQLYIKSDMFKDIYGLKVRLEEVAE